jgi:phosphatidylethanolamine/phosphatidyl-N-methylethanolamine N-methyltransferase
MRMSNTHNRRIYGLWAPLYDAVTERFFAPGRRRAMEVIDLHAGESVCFVGVGTGTDLLYLPPGVYVAGIDLSDAMLDRAQSKLPIAGCTVDLKVGDAQALPIADSTFDAAVLNLILSVVPDPARCISEALRVVRPGGRIVVFDKFLREDERPSLGRRLLNVITTLFGTDINRRLGDMLAGQPCSVVSDEPSLLGGMYRVVLLSRN